MKRSVLAVFGLSVLFVGLASADKYQTYDPLTGGNLSYRVAEVAPTAEELRPTSAVRIEQGLVEQLPFVGDISQLIVLGQKAFEIIKQGAPVVNLKRDTLSVVPQGISEWNQLSGWKSPVVRVYSVALANGYKKEVVQIRLKVSAVPGGQVNEKGQYLSNITIVPTMIRVGWGVNLDVWTESRDPLNVGTVDSPIAAIGMDVRFKAKTWITEVSGAQDYYIRGDGVITTGGEERLQVQSLR